MNYKLAATVLIALNDGEVNLKDHCDIYSTEGRELAEWLASRADVTNRPGFGSARSKMGAGVSTRFGAQARSRTITVRHNDVSRALVADMDVDDLAAALEEADNAGE